MEKSIISVKKLCLFFSPKIAFFLVINIVLVQNWIFTHFWNSNKCVFAILKMSKNVFLHFWKCQNMYLCIFGMDFFGNFNSLCDDVFLLNGVFFEELLRRLAPLIFSFTGVLKVMDDNDSESDMVRNFWKFCAASSAFSCIGDNAWSIELWDIWSSKDFIGVFLGVFNKL